MIAKDSAAKKVLIYDDDPDILEICSIILSAKGFTVACRNNCSAVMNDIETFGPSAILMDNWIPDIGGVKTVQLIKSSAHKNIPVVFFSANTQVEELARESGAEFTLKKPFEISELEQIMEEAVSYSKNN